MACSLPLPQKRAAVQRDLQAMEKNRHAESTPRATGSPVLMRRITEPRGFERPPVSGNAAFSVTKLLCFRYRPSEDWSGRRDSNPRPQPWQNISATFPKLSQVRLSTLNQIFKMLPFTIVSAHNTLETLKSGDKMETKHPSEIFVSKWRVKYADSEVEQAQCGRIRAA